jgi:hypothetical protein
LRGPKFEVVISGEGIVLLKRVIDARADAPASANAKPDSPPAPAASKFPNYVSFNDIRSRVEEMGVRIERYRGEVTGDLGVAFGELAAKQAELMAELERIGGENKKWDAARAEAVREAALDLRGQIWRLEERAKE